MNNLVIQDAMSRSFIYRSVFAGMILAAVSVFAPAQQVPSKPLSNPVYTPILLNPAYAGSKDFTQFSLTSRVLKSPDSQVLSFHSRLTRSTGGFTRFGLGAYAFRDQLPESWNTGIAVAGSYHIPLDRANVHLLSAGAALKAIMNIPGNAAEAVADSLSNSLNPNMDLGVYYYGPTAFAGISTTSLLGSWRNDGLTDGSEAYVPREYHFYGGYKFVLSRKSAVVLEPSLLISVNDSTVSELHRHMFPYLKLYLQNFYIGSYFKSVDQVSLFFQYQFPRFFTGVFLEFPRVGFLNDENIIFEIQLGVNLGQDKQTFLQYRHW